MAETLTLSTPLTKPSQTTARIASVELDIEQKRIRIQWVGNNGEQGVALYPTPAPAGSAQPSGAALLAALNTADLRNNSLVRRILTRLQTDGYIPAGTVSGTPD